jgi:hypothetical protein
MTDSGFPVSVGLELPTVTRTPGTEDLVRFAQGTNDAARLHHDQDYARSRGFPTVIVHGALKATLMSQVLTNWVGLRGWVSDFRAEYRTGSCRSHPHRTRDHPRRRDRRCRVRTNASACRRLGRKRRWRHDKHGTWHGRNRCPLSTKSPVPDEVQRSRHR